MSLPDPRDTPFVDVATAAQLTCLGRSKAYEMARRFVVTDGREGLPVVTFGRLLRVPTAALWRLAGLTPPGEPAPERDDDRPAQPVASITSIPVQRISNDGTPSRAT